ncbi:MAG: phosphoribosylamine--glycine ligase [Acaryochloridaceae cyanobacterium RL_2_7]|nr:phosphoribosylamine--glycine ligase [Acaryochloridaceae cyanobacterium RL_2_7]
MKFVVVGNGGREHAMAWSLLRSPQVERVYCLPGNGGTATLANCENVEIAVDDFAAIQSFVADNQIDLVAVGPELPLAMGLTDELQAVGVPVFGPNKEGAQIEASKYWAKQLMVEANVPTAFAASFEEEAAAIAYVTKAGAPIVIKADGLAAGKGVTVAMTVEEAIAAIQEAFSGRFGAAGARVVIEDCLTGQELSVLALTDGKTVVPLLPAQDHKRVGEGDTGPNTGGMGAYAPVPIVTPELMARVQAEVLEPTLAALQKRGIDYRGVLYAGLMIGEDGKPNVIEFNCRFGDPETQVVLPALETPVADLMLACVNQTLDQLGEIQFKAGASATVVLASAGYPGSYEKGKAISGLEAAEANGAVVFHAGTTVKEGQLCTSGGSGVGGDGSGGRLLRTAFGKAYEAVDQIQFEGVVLSSG